MARGVALEGLLGIPDSWIRHALVAALLCHPVTPCLAQDGHEPLASSDSLTFSEIFDSALAHAPETLETPVREGQARDYQAVGGSWIAGRPSLQLSHYNDSVLDNVGLREMELGIQLPLWRPGQRRNANALGERYDGQVSAWKTALAWTVAGRVRNVLAGMADAELGLTLQAGIIAEAERLRDITRTLFDAGEVARLELMHAEALLMDARADMLQAEAAMVDAERAYGVVTGLQVRPAQPYEETLTGEDDIGPEHPHLQYLRSNVDLALANVRQSENAAKGNPTLTIGTRRERADAFQDAIGSVAVQFNVPFGGESFVSAQTSSARRARVDAEVEYQNTFIRLNQALHEVEHDLFILREEEPLRRSQAGLSRERFDMAVTAFESGEITLAQVVVAQQQAQASERDLQMLLQQRRRLTIEFNQLAGVLP